MLQCKETRQSRHSFLYVGPESVLASRVAKTRATDGRETSQEVEAGLVTTVTNPPIS